jgi:hypothetical protein
LVPLAGASALVFISVLAAISLPLTDARGSVWTAFFSTKLQGNFGVFWFRRVFAARCEFVPNRLQFPAAFKWVQTAKKRRIFSAFS